ncbi:MAG TPA: tetratricopeptide repeat protein [Thermoanaerobaculia bacterium]
MRHLLAGCERCARLAAKVFHLAPKEDQFVSSLEALSVTDQRSRRVTEEEFHEIAAEKLLGWNQWACLETLPVEERLRAVRSSRLLQNRGLLCRLLEASKWARRDSPRTGVDIALLALEIADLLHGEKYGDPIVAGLRADAWASLAIARRMAGSYDDCQAAIEKAWAEHRRSPRDPIRRVELLCTEASLSSNRRDHRTAEALLATAMDVCRKAGNRHLEARALVQLGFVVSRVDPERSLEVTRGSMRLIDTADQRLELYARHNLAYALNSAGRPGEALETLISARPLYRRFNDSETRIRLGWLEGRILRSLGNLDAAIDHFEQAWSSFRRLDLYNEMELVSIELAWTHAKQHSCELGPPPIM